MSARHGEQRNWRMVTDRAAPVELGLPGGETISMSMSAHTFSRVERFCGHGCGWVVCDGVLGGILCPGCNRAWWETP